MYCFRYFECLTVFVCSHCLISVVRMKVVFTCITLQKIRKHFYLLNYSAVFFNRKKIASFPFRMNLMLTELLGSCKLLDLYVRRDSFHKLLDQLLSTEFVRYKKTHSAILAKAVKLSRCLYCGLLLSISCDVIGENFLNLNVR